MKRGIILSGFLGIIVLVMFLPMALAVDINVRTISGHKAGIIVLDNSASYKFLDSYNLKTGGNGVVKVTYKGNEEAIKVLVKITKDGETIINERFENMSTAGPMYLQVIPGKVLRDYKKADEAKAKAEKERLAKLNGDKAIVNDTVKNDSVKKDIKKSKGISGLAVSESDSGEGFKIPGSLYFIIGGLLVVGLLAFLGLKYGGNLKNSGSNDIIEPGTVGNSEGEAPSRKMLEDQLRESQKEISRLKKEEQNISKISQMERKLELDKEELRKLRKG